MPLPREFLALTAREKELSVGETEVLIELFGSNKSRQEVADSLHISDSALSTRLGKIYGKFAIKGSGPVKLQKLQDYLVGQLQKWKPAGNAQQDEAGNDIDTLVQAVREQIKPLIKERCGTMRVLDMTQPVALTGKQGIYTNVNILEKITGRRRLGIEELLKGCDLEEFDRLGLSRVTEKRVSGLTAVEHYSKLMVLGKPGAGKTTFLKYLAMQCIVGNFLADRIPIFITLKSFAEDEAQPNLLAHIERSITADPVRTNQHLFQRSNLESCQSIIQKGRLLILLDGLDEVREEDTTRVLRQIRDFSEKFYTNQFVVTCRIASKEYTFQQFTEVEVADFDDEQIHTFVENWFKCREPQSAKNLTQKLIERLEESKPVKELATNPLLLTLLCLEFEELLGFPTNRAELYERGLAVLLSKWDTSRRIERDQIYKRLSLKRKEDLLSQIALITFEQKDYFFKQKTVEGHIAAYISNLPDAQNDLEMLILNSEAVLKSIESQHGLLVERARGIYSFSHLTFHEYFTAREIVFNNVYQNLIVHVTERRWREVFLLATGMMRKADDWLQMMKRNIDQLINHEKKLQDFLCWIVTKSFDTPYKSAAIRFFYFNIGFNRGISYNASSDMDRFLTYSNKIDNSIQSIDHIPKLVLDHSLSHALRLIETINIRSLKQYDSKHSHPFNIPPDQGLYVDIETASRLDPTLGDLLPKLSKQLYNSFRHSHIGIDFLNWWRINGKDWANRFTSVVIENCDIGHNWQLSEQQQQLLRQYYDANELLVDCLNSDCYVSREVRQEIEDTLLLPIAELEKYKAAKAAQQSG
ncbi:NACHT domain-containing NTPase [Trichocoleus sp. FACHB-591]|uniref:NACHT domain-containing protein n=1 Tax=Trichocoleus sp. FACHB-591 TaxID=2692872 RepID=UPI001685EB07|nr:NACHT domain-containing NTPase [Trichocoleus sp. FACHB-591]MBD2098824.1 NACHT domain-containing NTPase [Trichocoleus sp. FACHB-591]